MVTYRLAEKQYMSLSKVTFDGPTIVSVVSIVGISIFIAHCQIPERIRENQALTFTSSVILKIIYKLSYQSLNMILMPDYYYELTLI